MEAQEGLKNERLEVLLAPAKVKACSEAWSAYVMLKIASDSIGKKTI